MDSSDRSELPRQLEERQKDVGGGFSLHALGNILAIINDNTWETQQCFDF